MQITVQHMIQDSVTGNVDGFRDVAVVDASRCDTVEEALEYAYRYTNNVMGSWSIKEEYFDNGEQNGDYNADVTVLYTRPDSMGQRSSMMGDRFVVDGVVYKCAAFGFKALETV